MRLDEKYQRIVNVLCNYYGREAEEFENIIKNKDNLYYLLLLLNRNKCMEHHRLHEFLGYNNKRSIFINLKRAEEKFLINKEFRERFFQIEELSK